MEKETVVIGFAGAGGIARSHAFALNALTSYYDNAPVMIMDAVCSEHGTTRKAFAGRFGFRRDLTPEEFFADGTINTVFILGPNRVHFSHLNAALGMPSVKRIYIEKPLFSTPDELSGAEKLVREHPGIKIQAGFQYLFSSSVREALGFWRSGILGRPLHFDFKYYHGDYLKKDYREKRITRLTPAPDGGAMADLGSHAISLLLAFMGNDLSVTGAAQAGYFEDVPVDSDLFSLITVYDKNSGASGTLSASRISSGTGDLISFELFAEKGALRYSTRMSDQFEYYLEDKGIWCSQHTAGNYSPSSTFPSVHVPAGWLRSMIHAQYVFLTGNDTKSFIPGIDHGIDVQRILNRSAELLKDFRAKVS